MSAESASAGHFLLQDQPGVGLIGHFPALAGLPGLAHVVATRHSLDPATPLPAAARQAADWLDLTDAAWCDQVHGRQVYAATKGGCLGPGDGLATARASLALVVQSADCPLILLADRQGRAVAAAHASWRGTVQQIAHEAVAKLVGQFGVRPEDLVACLCPSAGPCCYEVKDDVRQAALDGIGGHAEAFFHRDGGRMTLDLWSANADQLLRAGLREADIHVAGICTICRNDLFPSYRREGNSAGRFVAAVGRDERM